MQSLIIIFGLLVFTDIRPTVCGGTDSQDADLTPTTADEIRKAAIAERDAAIERAKSAYKDALAEIDVVRQEAEKERKEKMKSAEEQAQTLNFTASTIEKRAWREYAGTQYEAQNKYSQIIHETQESYKKINDEFAAAEEAAEDEFARKYAEIRDTRKRIEDENRELLEKVKKEIEAEQNEALERREQAAKEYKLSTRKRNAVSADEWNSMVSAYEEEMERYEQTVESLEEKWQKTLDDIGIGKQMETALDAAVTELEAAKNKIHPALLDARQEVDQKAQEARKVVKEKLMSVNAEKLRAEVEARELYKSAQNKRNKILEKADKNYRKMRKLIEAEMKNAEAERNRAIAEARSEYDQAWRKAKEVERTEKRTKSGKKYT